MWIIKRHCSSTWGDESNWKLFSTRVHDKPKCRVHVDYQNQALFSTLHEIAGKPTWGNQNQVSVNSILGGKTKPEKRMTTKKQGLLPHLTCWDCLQPSQASSPVQPTAHFLYRPGPRPSRFRRSAELRGVDGFKVHGLPRRPKRVSRHVPRKKAGSTGGLM